MIVSTLSRHLKMRDVPENRLIPLLSCTLKSYSDDKVNIIELSYGR